MPLLLHISILRYSSLARNLADELAVLVDLDRCGDVEVVQHDREQVPAVLAEFLSWAPSSVGSSVLGTIICVLFLAPSSVFYFGHHHLWAAL